MIKIITSILIEIQYILILLINKLDSLNLVEPLDLRITSKTMATTMDYSDCVYWDTSSDDYFKAMNPLIVIKLGEIVYTSVMLVFQKK